MTVPKIDNRDKPCQKCKRGKYIEKDLLEGLEGILRCSTCDEKVALDVPLAEGFDRFLQGVCEEEERKRTKKPLNEDSYGRRYVKKYGEDPRVATANKIVRGGK